MAVAKEFMGTSAFAQRSSFVSSSNQLFLGTPPAQRETRQFRVSPFWKPHQEHRRRVQYSKKAIVSAAAAASKDLVKAPPPEKAVTFKVRAVLTVRKRSKENLKEALEKRLDSLADWIGRNVVLELVSTEINPETGEAKKSKEAVLKDWSKKHEAKTERVNCTAEFVVNSEFGVPGAILVSNKHPNEFFVETITVEGFACGPIHFPCNSWVHSKNDHPAKRIFFSNKPYLPSDTPAGLRELREEELKLLRGDGKGTRKLSDRVYDFDVYNDLGNPDKGVDHARPTLGGKKIPFPRRCRTGRHSADTDMEAESVVEAPLPMYVPRDERFEDPKVDTFTAGSLKAALHNIIPSLMASISALNHDFKGFSDVDNLYKEGLLLKLGLEDEVLQKLPLPNLVSKIKKSSDDHFRYDTPKILSKDKFAWLRDDEFARQTIAGINPMSIQRLRVFPPVSNLDTEIHGPTVSALKEEHISGHLNGLSVQQALDGNKLFILDYHDVYLPFVDRINALDGRKAYATRTIFFLTHSGTLKPIAIELSLPPTGPSPRAKRVVTPPVDATTSWIWQLAKAHVCSNDAGVHQLVNHWLRTHGGLEPFFLAAHRHLSAMHPIFKLLDPHMRYTLEINALARQSLINADGIIESCFTPGRYSMEISAAAYTTLWRFDLEGLPADLIRRGMAVRDPSQPHGLKLLIEDYPFAADGLLIWDAIRDWVRTYVARYYPDPDLILRDVELQAWYEESIRVGHADVSHASWWPTLATGDDLASILTTIIWLASAQHAALNFGQYPYGGYIPNRPALMRRLIPDEGDPEYAHFLADPQRFFLGSLPSLLQATKLMAVLDTLSTHSPDEEYLGERQHSSVWSGDADMVEAFYRFSAEVHRIDREIDRRNQDPRNRNRCGAGVIPYELLAPSSGPGMTCRGIPNSISISVWRCPTQFASHYLKKQNQLICRLFLCRWLVSYYFYFYFPCIPAQ